MTAADVDIARMIARRRTIQRLGFYYYETNGRHHPTDKPIGAPRLSRSGGYQFRPGYLAAELDLLQHTLAFAHAGLDVRQARRAA